MSQRYLFLLALCLVFICCSCNQSPPESSNSISGDSQETEFHETKFAIELPLGLPAFAVPNDNPMTNEKVALGRKLFFDTNLSLDRTVSCASCHDPEISWGNGKALGTGIGGRTGTRNVPTLFNVAYYRQFFWDGRAPSLEAQALFPILNEAEMAMPSKEAVIKRLCEDPEYDVLFKKAFAGGMTITNMVRAIACFERTIIAGNSPYDRYIAGDKSAMSPSAIRGLDVFMNRAKCNGCHAPPTFIDFSYYNLGVGMDSEQPDLGRYHVFEMESAKGKFKTVTVRNVAETAPYMHDGSIKTLEEVVELYDQGGIRNRYLSQEIRKKLRLTEQEKKDLVTFMVEGLTSDESSKEPNER